MLWPWKTSVAGTFNACCSLHLNEQIQQSAGCLVMTALVIALVILDSTRVVPRLLLIAFIKHFVSKGWEQSCFLAACPDHSMLKQGCEVFGLSESEWLIRRSSDPLLHDTNINLTTTDHGFLYSVLKDLNPNVIHIHHYVHIGLDLLHALKCWFPKAKVILTLHEYWGLCPYEGRLLRRSGRFCDGPEPDDCAACVGDNMRLPLLYDV